MQRYFIFCFQWIHISYDIDICMTYIYTKLCYFNISNYIVLPLNIWDLSLKMIQVIKSNRCYNTNFMGYIKFLWLSMWQQYKNLSQTTIYNWKRRGSIHQNKTMSNQTNRQFGIWKCNLFEGWVICTAPIFFKECEYIFIELLNIKLYQFWNSKVIEFYSIKFWCQR